MVTNAVVIDGGVQMVRKKSRWFGVALTAMMLTAAGLVTAQGADRAASSISAKSFVDGFTGYA
jgi:hypothetical protein